MYKYEFNPFAKKISLRFTCIHCNRSCAIESLDVPQLDLEQDDEQSIKSLHHKSCPSCGGTINITIINSSHTGEAYIESLDRVEDYIESGMELYESLKLAKLE